jgi:hypothetical protein
MLHKACNRLKGFRAAERQVCLPTLNLVEKPVSLRIVVGFYGLANKVQVLPTLNLQSLKVL